MKLIIAGSRDLIVTPEEIQVGLGVLLEANPELPEFVTEVVSGKAAGIDTCGEVWARRYRIPVKGFKPDYAVFDGKQAPLERNKQMAEYADALIAIPSDKPYSGTKHMIAEMEKRGKPVLVLPNPTQPEIGAVTAILHDGSRVDLTEAALVDERTNAEIREDLGLGKPLHGGNSFGNPPLQVGDMQAIDPEDYDVNDDGQLVKRELNPRDIEI